MLGRPLGLQTWYTVLCVACWYRPWYTTWSVHHLRNDVKLGRHKKQRVIDVGTAPTYDNTCRHLHEQHTESCQVVVLGRTVVQHRRALAESLVQILVPEDKNTIQVSAHIIAGRRFWL